MDTCDHYNYVKIKTYPESLKKRGRNHVLAVLTIYMKTWLLEGAQDVWNN